MEIEEVRRQNLEALVRQHGSVKALARAAGVSANYLVQIRNEFRVMGSRFARKLEASLGLEPASLDQQAARERGPPGPAPEPPELALFRRLSRAEREAIVVLLRALVRHKSGNNPAE